MSLHLYQFTNTIEWNISDLIFYKCFKYRYWKYQNPFKQISDSSKISVTQYFGKYITSLIIIDIYNI